MGLFSSNYVTTVGTSVQRVIKDDLIVSSTKTGLVAGIFSTQQNQLVENVLESIVNGLGVRTERMFSYAKKNYSIGLPAGKVSTTSDGYGAAETLLHSVLPNATIDYYHVGPLNNLHVAWVRLGTEYGYNYVTNEIAALSTEKGYPVYLEDLVVVIKEATLTERDNGSLDQWGKSAKLGFTPKRGDTTTGLGNIVTPTPFRVNASAASDDGIEATYVWVEKEVTIVTPEKTEVINGATVVTPAVTTTKDTIHTESSYVPISGYDREKDYIHLKYTNEGNVGYLIYEIGTGTYPTIDTIFDSTPDVIGEFLPFIYFRQGLTNMNDQSTTPEYKQSKRMVKSLGMDYHDIIKAVQENPDIAKVEQALLMYAVPANTTVQIEQRYLFDFFNKLYAAAGGSDVGNGWDVGDVGEAPPNGEAPILSPIALLLGKIQKEPPRIRISIEDKNLSTALSCMGVIKRTRAGSVAPKGDYTSGFSTETVTYKYTKRELLSGGTDIEGNQIEVFHDVPYTYDAPLDVFLYKKQITEHVYEELVVYDLKYTFYMWGGYSTIADDLAPYLMVPLDHEITKTYSIVDRELLYTRSMHIIFNAREVTEVKWYQQGWFSTLIQIIGIVITVWSLGSDGGFFANLAVAVTENAVMAFVIATVKQILWNLVILEGLKLFVKAVGTDIAFLVAIVAMAYGSFKAYQAGSIKGAPWAKELLSLGNGLTTAVNKSITESLQLLSNEADQFNLLMKEKMDELKEVNKSMYQQDILQPQLIYGQTPDELYNLTYAGNIGVSGGIDSITSYVDIALTLPKISETIGSNEYV